MTPLLQIEDPGRTRPAPPQWSAFLELGFRPLYLAGCGWAAVSVALWVFAPGGLTGQLAGVVWHAHEMLWGFIATIAVGFLLTAGSNWTGMNPLKGLALAALTLLWVVARAGFLIPPPPPPRPTRRNFGVPPLVFALGLADALFLWAAGSGDHAALMRHFHTGLLCMAV